MLLLLLNKFSPTKSVLHIFFSHIHFKSLQSGQIFSLKTKFLYPRNFFVGRALLKLDFLYVRSYRKICEGFHHHRCQSLHFLKTQRIRKSGLTYSAEVQEFLSEVACVAFTGFDNFVEIWKNDKCVKSLLHHFHLAAFQSAIYSKQSH